MISSPHSIFKTDFGSDMLSTGGCSCEVSWDVDTILIWLGGVSRRTKDGGNKTLWGGCP
jgi:hypothetical protein